MARNIHYHSRRAEGEHSEKILGQIKSKTNWTDSKLCISRSGVKARFRSPTPFNFLDSNTLLSLGLVPSPVSSFPRQVFHDSGISSILESPRQSSSSHLHEMASLGLRSGTPLTRVWPQWLSLGVEGNSTTLSCILDSKIRTTWLKLPSSTAWWGWSLTPSFKYIFTSFLVFDGFLNSLHSFP